MEKRIYSNSIPDAELVHICVNYPKKSPVVLAKELGRSPRSISSKIYLLRKTKQFEYYRSLEGTVDPVAPKTCPKPEIRTLSIGSCEHFSEGFCKACRRFCNAARS